MYLLLPLFFDNPYAPYVPNLKFHLMQKSLIIMLLATIGLLTSLHRQNRALREEAERLAANYRAMTDTVTARRSTSGRSVRAVQTLSLTPEELTAPLFASRLATVADIGVKSKRVNELTTVGTEMRVEVVATSNGTIPNIADRTMTSYKYHDPWVDIAVDIGSPPSHPDDRMAISLVVRDTLTLVEHRVPRRIWFIKFGTKCVKREVVASCPYTEVVMAERIVAM
jgi:hypothetical protein